MMDNRPIGVFDSGLGGLTCVKELIQTLPKEGIVYFGDTGRVPYGTRSAQTIIKYTQSDINFLSSFDVKLIVAACGTASSVALDKIQTDIPVIGVLEAVSQGAVKKTNTGKIGVLGTSGTIASGKYIQALKDAGKKLGKEDITVTQQACPLFVPLVENGYLDHGATYLLAREYLKPLQEQEVDTVILGCTHYPMLKKVIGDVMGFHVVLIDAGYETAKQVQRFLQSRKMLCDVRPAEQYRFYVSDETDNFGQMAGMFLNRDISGNIEKIDIEQWM